MKTRNTHGSGLIGKRFSNWQDDPGSGLFVDPGVTGGNPDVTTRETSANNGSSGSGWTSEQTVETIKTGASTIESILNSIFGRNNIQQANYATALYNQEKRTNTILWVVIGLLLAMGVVLVIRKTK